MLVPQKGKERYSFTCVRDHAMIDGRGSGHCGGDRTRTICTVMCIQFVVVLVVVVVCWRKQEYFPLNAECLRLRLMMTVVEQQWIPLKKIAWLLLRLMMMKKMIMMMTVVKKERFPHNFVMLMAVMEKENDDYDMIVMVTLLQAEAHDALLVAARERLEWQTARSDALRERQQVEAFALARKFTDPQVSVKERLRARSHTATEVLVARKLTDIQACVKER